MYIDVSPCAEAEEDFQSAYGACSETKTEEVDFEYLELNVRPVSANFRASDYYQDKQVQLYFTDSQTKVYKNDWSVLEIIASEQV